MKFIRSIRNDPKSWVKEAFPICKWLPLYKPSYAPYDIISGLTVGFTLLPVSLAYAQMAYLRPEYGLYSSFIGTIVYIFLGTSKDAIVGPSAIGSMLLAQFNVLSPLYTQGDNTYATVLTLISGIVCLIVGLLKLGFIVNLFSIPVVSGFTSAAAFAIFASQLRTLLGIRKGPNDSPGVFVKQIKNVYDKRDEILLWDVAFGLSALGFLLFCEYGHDLFTKYVINRCSPPKSEKMRKVRNVFIEILRLLIASRNIIVFIPSTAIAYYMYRQDPANIEKKLTMVGYIKPGFPSPQFPSFELINRTRVWVNSTDGNGTWVQKDVVLQSSQQVIQALSVGIIIIPLMTIMEMFGILKALGRKNGYRIDATQELVAIGLSNFLNCFIHSQPITVATAKTALNERCRVKTQLSTVFSVAIILVTIGYFTDVFYFVPKASLAAILIAAAHHLFDYHAAINIWKEHRPDLALFVFTFLMCLFYDLAYGIVIAILINMVIFLRPIIAMQMSVVKEPIDVIASGLPVGRSHKVTIVQLSHGMKYPSVDKFIDKMTSLLLNSTDVHFVLDCRFVSGFDFTGIQAWRMLLRMVYQNKKHIIFTNLPEHARQQLEKFGLEHFKHAKDVENAILAFSDSLDAEYAHGHTSEEANMKRLRQSFSVIDGTQGQQNGNAIVEHHGHQTPSYGTTGAGNHEEDRKVQEARLASLIMEMPTPNIYGDIQMTIGNVQTDSMSDDSNPPAKITEFPPHPVMFTTFGKLENQVSKLDAEEIIEHAESRMSLRRRKVGNNQSTSKAAATQTE